jgi:hypothetical protein
MQNDKHRLEAIVNDSGSTPTEKAVAKAQLAALERNDLPAGDFSEQNIFRLLADDGVIGMDDEYLRAVYLADSGTSIWWARLSFWRDRLKSGSQTLRSFSKDRIQKFADDSDIPADVRKAAGDLLTAFNQRKPGDSVPAIQIPGNERWKTMPGDELYFKHMAPIKKRVTETFYSPR